MREPLSEKVGELRSYLSNESEKKEYSEGSGFWSTEI